MARFDGVVYFSSSFSLNHRFNSLQVLLLGAKTVLLAFFLLLILLSAAWSQTNPLLGILPFSTQDPGIYESIDIASSNINVTIPVRKKSGKMPFDYSLVMNSRAYTQPGSPGWIVSGAGGYNGLQAKVSLSAGVADFNETSPQISCNGGGWNGSVREQSNFYIVDSTGAIHLVPNMGPVWQGVPVNCEQSFPSGWTIDGSGYTVIGTPSYTTSGGVTFVSYLFTTYDRSGNAFGSFPTSPLPANNVVQDPDGVAITQTTVQTSYVYTDSLGASAMTATGATFQYNDANGNPQSFQANSTSFTQQTAFGCTSASDISPRSAQLPTSITTPTGTITFAYETTPGDTHTPHYVTGRLAKLTYPSGGSVSYSYSGGNNGITCNSSVVPTLTKTITDNNGHISTWQYVNANTNNGTNNPYTVTVTDPANNQTVYTFIGEYQTQVKYYQGTATGTPLKTVVTCYDGHNSSQSACVSTPFSTPITQTDAYTYLGSSSTPSLEETKVDTYGNVAEVNNYDFGVTYPPSGTPVSTVDYAYNDYSHPACGTFAVPIRNRPCSVITYSYAGGKHVAQQTNYSYNATGHPIQTSKLVSGGTYVTSYASYNANGTLHTTTDAKGNVATYNYDGSCNSMLSTSTTFPTVNGVTQTTSQAWDCNGGVMTSSSDANTPSNVTHYYYNDPLWRQTEVLHPDGGSTTTSYSTSALPWSISTSTAIANSMNLSNTAILDGLGRVVQTQLTSDPDGTDYVDTTYDLVGRKATVSNPHRSTSSSSDGIATYGYDALGRVVSVLQPDNSSISTVFNNNCTTVTDEAGKSRKSCSDGLGRLTQLFEDPANLNYETDYAYDAIDNLTAVTQKGGSAQGNWRTRTFSYDSLSRLLSATNPESGTITYTYDANGNVITKTDARNITTTMSYDALNRLLNKTYSDGTPSPTFYYDVAPFTWASGIQNTTGRMVEATTGVAEQMQNGP